MIIFLILAIAIVSAITIIMGYVAPYVFLQYYAMKRKTTIKSLISLIEDYSDLSEAFATSKFIGYVMTVVFVFAESLDLVSHPLSYTDMMVGCIMWLLTVIVSLIYWIGYFIIKTEIDFVNDCLHNQSIKL